ncbi:MAG: RecQ family ATP-dependent DNA helicase [Firmicutes bacterium]|nr:RecQ family ATP-dependent DNA helicase [Bacillota bacterium]MCL1954292.1 RecQ family ATP-dependent DNA helicase [Bacillota bacterium]
MKDPWQDFDDFIDDEQDDFDENRNPNYLDKYCFDNCDNLDTIIVNQQFDSLIKLDMDNICFFDTEIADNFDTEIADNGKILDIGAVSTSGEFHHTSIQKFVDFAKDYKYLVGHNIVDFDIKYLPSTVVSQLSKKYIDTLYVSALLFSKNPYHNLGKDEKFVSDEKNNPLSDSKKARDLFCDCVAKWDTIDIRLRDIYTGLLIDDIHFKHWFEYLGIISLTLNLASNIKEYLQNKVCENIDFNALMHGQSLISIAFVISLIDAMEDESVSILPYWIIKNNPSTQKTLHILKNNNCGNCKYCNQKLDAVQNLKKWFTYDNFRTYDGMDLQRQIVDATTSEESLLAVLPTGGGKSITFQLPALMQWQNLTGLTVIISPLQSLQKDQVDNLENRYNITQAVRLDGSLDPVERTVNIRQIENGNAGLLYLSPESLRSKSTFSILLKRNVVRFVIDEAHCFSAWGQDFRPDYLYIADFIAKYQEFKQNYFKIPVSCFTATAKPEVIKDIKLYFKSKLNLDLKEFTVTTGRTNLLFFAIYVKDDTEKDNQLREILNNHQCTTIIYVSRTRRADELADKLNQIGLVCVSYHGKMDKTLRKSNQELFLKGEVNLIVATKAFGMGVDKDNVGLVVHYDISTTLEDYVQEAGRAGRDPNLQAQCIALYNDDDINKHFAFLNQTKITQKEINEIWRGIWKGKNKDRFKNNQENSVSSLELARDSGWSDQNENDISTRVITCVNALEQASFIKRKENMPRVFANSLLVDSVIECRKKIGKCNCFDNDQQKEEAVKVVARLLKTRAKGKKDVDDNNQQVDHIADREQLTTQKVLKAIEKLRECGVLADDKDLYARLNKDKGREAKKTFDVFVATEEFLYKYFEDKNLEKGTVVNIKKINTEMLKDVKDSSIAHINKTLNFLSTKRIIKRTKQFDQNTNILKLYITYDEMINKGKIRHDISRFIISYLYEKLSKDSIDENDTKVNFSVLELRDKYNHKNTMFGKVISADEVEDSLLWLKRINCIDTEGGFLVIYNKMIIQKIAENTKKYTKEHYKTLENYYENCKEKVHIIGEYLDNLAKSPNIASAFIQDYFNISKDMFKQKYFRGRSIELKRNMTPKKYNAIFNKLSIPQAQITDDTQSKYISVIAGPGSGKTMLLVHKIASVYFQEDIKHEQILMLTFSRAAANEFKTRLIKLIGNAGLFVTIKTFHGYCFDILGKVGSEGENETIIKDAIDKADKIAKDEIDSADKSKLLKSILVIDEAQDMSKDEFDLVSQLIKINDGLKIIAVGDDDQNIYQFRYSSSEYLARIAKAEEGKMYELLDNYRSASNIVEFAKNYAKANITNRLKTNPLKAIKKTIGNIKLTKHVSTQFSTPLIENCIADGYSGTTCLMVQTNQMAQNIVGELNHRSIAARLIQSNDGFKPLDLCEIRYFYDIINKGDSFSIDIDIWKNAIAKLKQQFASSDNLDDTLKLISDFEALYPKTKYKVDFGLFLEESKLEDFLNIKDCITVSTIHKTKGKEFDNVYIGCSYFNTTSNKDKGQAERELYVGITRAKNNLSIHYVGSTFDNITASNCQKYIDNTRYDKPKFVASSVGHKQIFLSKSHGFQNTIKQLKAGYVLQSRPDGLYYHNSPVAIFSKAYREEMQKYENQGYSISTSKVRFVVYWKDVDAEKECLIVLAEIGYINNQI